MDPRAPLSVDQAAELLLCTPATVRDMLRDGRLAGVKVGRDWVLPAGAFYARLDQLAIEQAQERRAPAQPAATLHPMPAPSPAGQQAGQQAGQRARRQPPALPSVPALGA
jgi:excisionase family DNA binding protein